MEGKLPCFNRASIGPLSSINDNELSSRCIPSAYFTNDGHDTRAIQHYLGPKNIQQAVRSTELSAERFKGFWGD
jgi:hypothetical protein